MNTDKQETYSFGGLLGELRSFFASPHRGTEPHRTVLHFLHDLIPRTGIPLEDYGRWFDCVVPYVQDQLKVTGKLRHFSYQDVQPFGINLFQPFVNTLALGDPPPPPSLFAQIERIYEGSEITHCLSSCPKLVDLITTSPNVYLDRPSLPSVLSIGSPHPKRSYHRPWAGSVFFVVGRTRVQPPVEHLILNKKLCYPFKDAHWIWPLLRQIDFYITPEECPEYLARGLNSKHTFGKLERVTISNKDYYTGLRQHLRPEIELVFKEIW